MDGCYRIDGGFPNEDLIIVRAFAEAIVQECIDLLPEENAHAENGCHLSYVFKEHFGME